MNGGYDRNQGAVIQHLSTDEMVVLAQVFQESYSHVMNNRVGDSKQQLTEFVLDIILRHKPYMLVTPEGFTDASTKVFTSEDRRDFVFTLFYVFSARAGLSQDRYRGLVANIAQGASPVSRDPELSGAPLAVADRLAAFEDAANLLDANQWLVTLLLLQLFITVELQPA